MNAYFSIFLNLSRLLHSTNKTASMIRLFFYLWAEYDSMFMNGDMFVRFLQLRYDEIYVSLQPNNCLNRQL